MILRRWNYKTHKYDKVQIPDNWYVSIYEDNMNIMVNCPHCGKALRFGETYTSKEFHDFVGFGYGVCEECYEKEWERYLKERKEEE